MLNTTYKVKETNITVTLHQTYILKKRGQSITLNTGGFLTNLTVNRMNHFSVEFCLGFVVSRAKSRLNVRFRDGSCISTSKNKITFDA